EFSGRREILQVLVGAGILLLVVLTRHYLAAGRQKPTAQVGTNLNLDKLWGPVAVDRRHILALSGRLEIPKTHGVNLSATMRYMSGAPFTILDTNSDVDRNGELFDPLPAGIYSGTAPGSLQNVKYNGGVNGAYGPNFFQTDLRITYRQRFGEAHTMELTAE